MKSQQHLTDYYYSAYIHHNVEKMRNQPFERHHSFERNNIIKKSIYFFKASKFWLRKKLQKHTLNFYVDNGLKIHCFKTVVTLHKVHIEGQYLTINVSSF